MNLKKKKNLTTQGDHTAMSSAHPLCYLGEHYA